MGTNPEESSLQELATKLARAEQINADLRAKLATKLARAEQINADLRAKLINLEASRVAAQTSVPVPHASEQLSAAAPTTLLPQLVRVSRWFKQRRFSIWQTILLVALALVSGFAASSFLFWRVLNPPPYRGDGYTITPLVGWQVQPEPFGVVFSDPRFPMTSDRDASQLGVANNDPLLLEDGSWFLERCQSIGGVPGTATIAGAVWAQSQYNCAPLQQGGVASLLYVLFTTHGAAHKSYAIYYLTAVDRLADFSNGSFASMARTFTFS